MKKYGDQIQIKIVILLLVFIQVLFISKLYKQFSNFPHFCKNIFNVFL